MSNNVFALDYFRQVGTALTFKCHELNKFNQAIIKAFNLGITPHECASYVIMPYYASKA